MSYRGEMSVCLQRESSEFSGLLCQVCGCNKDEDLLGSTNVVNGLMVWKAPIIEGHLNLEGWDN